MKKVIVIGAGILGTATAYHLSKQGVSVTLIDRQDAGQATSAAAGIICPWLSQRRNKTWYRLAKNGAHYYESLITALAQEGETQTGYAKVGALCLQQDVEKLLAMQSRAEKRKVDAPEIGTLTKLTQVEAKQYFPMLTDGYEVLHVSGAARVDGQALTAAMRRVAIKYGASVVTGEAYIQFDNHTVTGVTVNGEWLEADEVVVCAGAWSNALLHPLGIDVNVSYQKAQIIHLKTHEHHNTGSWPVVIPPNDQYLLAFDNQKVVIGATHENDVVGYDLAPTVKGIHDILHKGIQTASGIEKCEVEEVKVGFRPFTANFLPVFGRVAGWGNLLIGNGLGSSGLTAGPYIGQLLAKLTMDEQIELPIEDYAPELAASINK